MSGEIAALGGIQKYWGWIMMFGVISLVLGLIGVGMAVFLTIASMVFFGVLLLVGGVMGLVNSLKHKTWKSTPLHTLIAALYVIGGIVVIRNPVLASSFFTLLIAMSILLVGIARIVMAFQHRGWTGWGWMLFSGVLAVFLGVMILSRWPASGMVVIGLFIAIEMIINGWTYIMLALAARAAGGGAAAR